MSARERGHEDESLLGTGAAARWRPPSWWRPAAPAWPRRRRRARARRRPAARPAAGEPAGQGRRAALRAASPACAATRPTAWAASPTASTWAATTPSRRSTTPIRDKSEQFTNAAADHAGARWRAASSQEARGHQHAVVEGRHQRRPGERHRRLHPGRLPARRREVDSNPPRRATSTATTPASTATVRSERTPRRRRHPTRRAPTRSCPLLRNPADDVSVADDVRARIMDGSITAPGKKGELLMPAWGQILSTRAGEGDPAVHPVDGPKARRLPPPPPPTPLVSPAAAPSPAGSP